MPLFYSTSLGTIRALKQEIRAVGTIIPTMKIDEFNDHVSRLITTLESHGVDMPDLMDHLFAAYRKAADNKFREHIEEVNTSGCAAKRNMIITQPVD